MKVAETGWVIRMKNSEWCRKLVPEMRWSMSEGLMSDFEWWWWFNPNNIRWRACVVTVTRLNRDKMAEWYREFCERDDFIFNSFRNYKPVKRFQNGSDMLKFWRLDNSSSKSILDMLETIYLLFRKTIVHRVAVVNFGVYDGGGNCFGGVKVKIWTDTAESTNVTISGFRQCRDLIGKRNIFVKYEGRLRLRADE